MESTEKQCVTVSLRVEPAPEWVCEPQWRLWSIVANNIYVHVNKKFFKTEMSRKISLEIAKARAMCETWTERDIMTDSAQSSRNKCKNYFLIPKHSRETYILYVI